MESRIITRNIVYNNGDNDNLSNRQERCLLSPPLHKQRIDKTASRVGSISILCKYDSFDRLSLKLICKMNVIPMLNVVANIKWV